MKASTIITAAAAGVGTYIASSVIANAQPDGIDPPAGPVADTQPSLASIDQKLDNLLLGGGSFPPDLRYAYDGVLDKTVTLVDSTEADFVRLYGAQILASSGNLLVGDSEDQVAVLGGSALIQSNQQLRGGTNYDFGGLKVPTPVKFRNQGTGNASLITLLYWIEE